MRQKKTPTDQQEMAPEQDIPKGRAAGPGCLPVDEAPHRAPLRLGVGAFLCVLLFFHSVMAWPQDANRWARVAGRVFDQVSGAPLADVQVYIPSLRRGDVTDEDGRYAITQLPAGAYTLVFALQGYLVERRTEVVLQPGGTTRIDVAMTATVLEMEEVVISASRSAGVEHELSQSLSVVTAEEIRRRTISQTPEILREEVGLFVQKTNHGGGSPILRGFRSNRLLLLVDGIRLNNSTYRGGNHQYLNTVDPQSLDRLEVVHGPMSALYGSDALGGTINAITRTPSLVHGGDVRWNSSFSGRLSTADRSRATHFGLEVSDSRWGLWVGASYRSYGDVTRGSAGGGELMRRLAADSRARRSLPRTQSPNGYSAFGVNAKALFQLAPSRRLVVAYQMDRQNAVPRYDVIEARKDSVWLYDPQERDLAYVQYQDFQRHPLFDFASLTLSLHRQAEGRLRQKFGSVHEFRDWFRTLAFGAQLQLNKSMPAQIHWVYGAELYYDAIASRSSRRNTVTGAVPRRDPLYPGGSTYLSFGAFVHGEWRPRPGWMLTLGTRFSAFALEAPFESYQGELQSFGTVRQSPTAMTARFGAKVPLFKTLSFVTNIAQGFRAPNLDDVSKLGPGKGESFFEIPNPQVKPEKTVSLDAGFKVTSGQVRVRVIGYTNFITDLLLRRPAMFNGLPHVVQEGDTLWVMRKENAGQAVTTGFELQADWLLSHRLALFGNLSYTYGDNTTDREPLTGIPPLHGLVGGRWSGGKFWLEASGRFAAAQERLSSEDKQDLRIPEGGTPGWVTINLRSGIELAKGVSMGFAVENLLDRNYREHMSGFNAPGRSFIFSARLGYSQ